MNSHSSSKPKYVHLLQEFSIPLLFGVVVALILANTNYPLYDKLVHNTYAFVTGEKVGAHVGDAHTHDQSEDKAAHGEEHIEGDGELHGDEAHADEAHGDEAHDDEAHDDESHGEGHDSAGGHAEGWRHYATLHFIINDLFMVIFFGIAAKEITESCLPGGALNPPSKAINPLLGTIGGVLGPVGCYLALNTIMGEPAWQMGWGIPTATDIALAWLIARLVFGAGHPAISFLLLLAVADDGIGLGIIAFAYPDPNNATQWLNALWILPGMAVAYGFRKMDVRSWIPYILIGGGFAWWGLYSAHLHPALALVPIVPFLPGPLRDVGIFKEEAGVYEDNPLDRFEHELKTFVDFGLFFFAFANAGVPFSNINNLTWIVLLSLIIGKTVGITFFSYIGMLIGFPLPTGMKVKHLVVAGIVAGLGLTVALFVAGQAFSASPGMPNAAEIMKFQGAAKMGALFSAGAAIIALVLGRILGVMDGDEIETTDETVKAGDH